MIRKLALTVLVAVALFSNPAVATGHYNTTPVDYYNSTTPTVDNATWIDGRTNASVENYANYMSRIGTIFIGGDGKGAGVVLTGLFLAVVLGGAAAAAGVGFVAGAVLAIVAAGALVIAGFAPMWLYAIAVFAVGAAAAAVAKRLLR